MTRPILQAFILLNILTLSTISTAGAEENVHVKQIDFPELLVPVHFPATEQLANLIIVDIKFTPDNQSFLLLTSENLYRYDLHTETIHFLATSPNPGVGRSMVWINKNQQLLLWGKLFQWPSLKLLNESWFSHTVSLDRLSMLYQRSQDATFFLLNFETGGEMEISLPNALQYVDCSSKDKTVTYTWGITNTYDHGSRDSGTETKPIFLTTWSYASQSEIHSVTLEGAYAIRGGGARFSHWSNTVIFDQFELQHKKYLLGVIEGNTNGDLPNNFYIPFIWDLETGSSMNFVLWETVHTKQFIFDQIPYGVSPDGKWFVTAVSNFWMKIIPFENRLKGIIDLGFGPFPKGRFAFSHDSKRLVVYYPITEDIKGEYKMAIIDLEPASPVNDFPLHQN